PSSHRATFWTVFALLGLLLASFLAAQDADWLLTPHEVPSLVPPLSLALLAFSPGNYEQLLTGNTDTSFRAIPFALAFWAAGAWPRFALPGPRFGMEFGRRAAPVETRSAVRRGLASAWLSLASRLRAAPRRLVRAAVVALPSGVLGLLLVQVHEADEA